MSERTTTPSPLAMSIRHRLLAGGAWAFAGRAISVVMGLALSALLARLLTPSDMGAYFLAFSIVTVAAMIARMGLDNAVVKLLAERVAVGHLIQARRVLRPIVGLATIGALVVGGVLAVVVGPWLATDIFRSSALGTVTELLGVWVAALVFQVVLAEAFRGLHDIRLATLFGTPITSTASAGVFAVVWIVLRRAMLGTVITISAGIACAAAVVAAIGLWRRVRRFHTGPHTPVPLRYVLEQSWPLLITNATAIVATQVDLWIVGAFRSDVDVAIYGAAARLVQLVSVSLTIANQVLPPLISELHVQRQHDRLQRILRGTAALAGLPAAALLALFVVVGGPILSVTFGPQYGLGAAVLALLSIGRCVGVYVGACEFTLIMTGNQKTLALITAATAVALALGTFLAVQTFGVLGVAAVSSGIIATQQVVMLVAARRRAGVWTHASPALLVRALPDLFRRLRNTGRGTSAG